MPKIELGLSDITNIKQGANQINKVMLGTNLVWQKEVITDIILDRFNRADGAVGVAETGQTWSIFQAGGTTGQSFAIVGGEVTGTVAGKMASMIANGGTANGAIEVIHDTISGVQGIVIRAEATGKNYYLWHETAVNKFVNGSWNSDIWLGGSNPVAGEKRRVEMDRNMIRLFVNDVQVFAFSDSLYNTQTYHGLFVDNALTRLDNFRFYAGMTGTPQPMTMNFVNKVSGSTTANPHIARGQAMANGAVLAPASWTGETAQANYDGIKATGGTTWAIASQPTGYMVQPTYDFNIGNYFDVTQISTIRINIYAWADYGTANGMRLEVWNQTAGAYQLGKTTTQSTPALQFIDIISPTNNPYDFVKDGHLYVMTRFSAVANGTNSFTSDYIEVIVTPK